VKATLLEKWKRHEEQAAIMQEIVRKYGLSQLAMAGILARTMGVEPAGSRRRAFHLHQQ
jgi:hypothetical protein